MIFNLSVGFTGLSDNSGQKCALCYPSLLTLVLTSTTLQRYALNLVDTVKIEAESTSLMTEGVKSPKDTLFFLTPESEEEKEKKPKRPPVAPLKNGSPAKAKTVGGKVLRNQTRRAAQDEVHQTALAKLIEHQRELHENLQAQGLAKASEEGAGSSGKEGKGWKKFQSYKGEGALPPEIEKLRIFVDRKAQTVVLPIHGFAVPFHINTIKNASKSDEGDFTYLRINFQTPGQLAGKKEDTVGRSSIFRFTFRLTLFSAIRRS
jgi:nucleosome binding factor SPN SPT16 subunit